MIHRILALRSPFSLVVAALLLTILRAGAAPEPEGAAPSPPPTRREEVRDLMHGVEIVDHYRWLEDQNSPETRAWIDAQNRYALSLLGDRPERDRIRGRLTDLMKIDRVWAPYERGGRYFVWKKRAEDDLSVLHVRSGLTGKDEVLIDPHALSPDHTTSVTTLDIARDGSILVYGVRRGGEDEIEVRVMSVADRKDLPDRLPRSLYIDVALLPDKSGFFYGVHSRETGTRIRHHALGTPGPDREIFGGEYGPETWLSPAVSDDGRWLLITASHGWARSEIFLKDLSSKGPITPIVKDLEATFYPTFAGDRIVMQTNWEAPKGRILVVDPANPSRDRWRVAVPEGEDVIEEFTASAGRIFVVSLHDVSSRIRAISIDGKPLGELPLPGIGSADAPRGNWDGKEAFFSFSSFTVPRTVFRYDTATGRSEVWARDEIPFKPDPFETRQIWYASKDGTKVPMFLVHRKGIPIDGKRPTLLHGYGGFNVSQTPGFSATAAWWVEQGGVYALANLRGGGEFGEAWHRAGMLDKKQNVFDDFIAAAEWLIKNRWTSPDRLAIRGGSNGGLLVGAALTQRPDLFRAVLCLYPDLDMVRYYLFENNNPPALLEYGDASDPLQFKFLHAYSPYQRVTKGVAYPAVMLTTGDADTRVPPLQARKMTAALQWATSSGRPVVLHYDTKAGHAGGRPFGKIVEDLSLELTFLWWQLGMDRP